MQFKHFKNPVTVSDSWHTTIDSLRSYRTHKGISQEKLAFEIGCEPSLVQKWETYNRVPSGFMFSCWLDALDLEISIKEKR